MAEGFDTVVIGGGVMGCGIAWQLAQAGQRVLVLERSVPGAEASSAAAGILSPHLESEAPGPFLQAALASRARFPAWSEALLERTGIDIGHRTCGVLAVAFDEAELARLQERLAWQRSLGLEVEPCSGEELRRLEPALSPRVVGGLRAAGDGQVEPRWLVRALAVACLRAGVVFRSLQVESLWLEAERCLGVHAGGESLRADTTVVAAGAWSAKVPGSERWTGRVVPARGQLVQLHAPPGRSRHVVFDPRGYLVPRPDGRVLVGATLEFAGFEKRVTASGLAGLLQLATDVVPALADAPVGESWAGFRPHAGGALPLIGPTGLPGLQLATGHHRNGILLTPFTAELVAKSVLGTADAAALAPFAPAPISSSV